MGSEERGAALIVALMAMVLVMAIGAGLILSSSSESMVAANFSVAAGAKYAADAMLERLLGDLAATANWTDIPSGMLASGFVDGSPGLRTLADRRIIDLNEVRNRANCEKPTACSAADLDAITTERSWGALNPRWVLYAHGPLPTLIGGRAADAPFYVVGLVADDPTDNDGDPGHDGVSTGPPNPGRQVLVLRAEAFGPRSAHHVVEATVARIDTVPPTLVLRSRRDVP